MPAQQLVLASVAAYQVIACTAVYQVCAVFTAQHIIGCAADDQVVACTASHEDCTSAPADKHIIAVTAYGYLYIALAQVQGHALVAYDLCNV